MNIIVMRFLNRKNNKNEYAQHFSSKYLSVPKSRREPVCAYSVILKTRPWPIGISWFAGGFSGWGQKSLPAPEEKRDGKDNKVSVSSAFHPWLSPNGDTAGSINDQRCIRCVHKIFMKQGWIISSAALLPL